MNVESLNCPRCGAPLLSLQAEQKLAVCGYCNTTLRISLDKPIDRAVAVNEDISPAVIDEVKRLLVLGQAVKATQYYRKQTGLPDDQASAAVQSLRRTIGYKPPLNGRGILILAGLLLLSAAGVAGGVALLANERVGWGVLLILVALAYAAANWYAFRDGLRARLLVRNGLPAQAQVLRNWVIQPVRQGNVSGHILRLLLEVQSEGSAAYQAEANCLVSDGSRPRFEPGARLTVRVDRRDRRKVVVTGMV